LDWKKRGQKSQGVELPAKKKPWAIFASNDPWISKENKNRKREPWQDREHESLQD